MQKLTSRQIIRLHRLHRDGARNYEIAKALDVHRNTVTYHLSGDFEYEPHVSRSLGITAPLRTEGWLSLQDAARLIPGHPSRPKMRTLVRGRLSRDASKLITLRSEIVDGHRLTKASWIRAWCSKVYPLGLWASRYWAEGVLELQILDRMDWEKIGILGEPLEVVWMPLFVETAGATFVPTARDIHRADRILQATGVCVL